MSTEAKQTNLKIWVGHALTIAFAGIGLAFSYGAMDARMSDMERRVDTLEERLLPMMHSLRDDINDVKVKLAEVSSDVRWLKGQDSKKDD